MRRFTILLFSFLAIINCYGQDAIEKNSLSLNIGPSHLMRQDLVFSPFIHSDLSIMNIGLAYTHQANLFHKVSLRYGNYNPMVSKPYDFAVNGEIETAYPHNFNLIDIDYLIGKVFQETEKTKLTVGGMFSTDIHTSNYVYGRISSFGYYSAFGLGIFGRYGVTFKEKHMILASLKLPLVSWVSRPPYMGIDDEYIENISSHSGFKTFMAFVNDGELVTWNKLQTFDAGIEYNYILNEKWNLGAGYLYEFVHSRHLQKLISTRNTINASLTFRF